MALRQLPPPPQTQCRSPNATFQLPPLDGTLTLVEICDWHSKHNPNYRFFVFADEEGQVHTISWTEAAQAIRRGAKITLELFKKTGVNREDSAPVVAILAQSADTISYFTMLMAIQKSNGIAFPISPRNSPAAVAHLLSKVNARYVLLGRESAMLDLANAATAILRKEAKVNIPNMSLFPVYSDLYSNKTEPFCEIQSHRRDADDIMMYLHSSGSTAFPKPIPFTNQRFLEICLMPYFGERDLTGLVLAIQGLPLYHSMGVAQIAWAAGTGASLSVFEPRIPAIIPTPQTTFKALKDTESDVIFSVPTFIESWSRDPATVKWLARRTGVLFGGGPLEKSIGDYLTSQGVALFVLYGITEAGLLSFFIPVTNHGDWEYFKYSGNIEVEMRPQGENVFELVIIATQFNTPPIVNTKVNGVDAFASSDLMIPHPTRSGYWRVYGRADDQIVHSTGEKTNPGPLESILNQDPYIKAAVYFGHQHFTAGVVVEPKPQYAFDTTSELELAAFRNKIWPTIERANTFAPQHSRVFKEMILVGSPSKPFEYTGKGTARRQAILRDYASEIETLYRTVDAGTQSNITPPTTWDLLSTAGFVRELVKEILLRKVSDVDDIFENGCDSLQATWIRNIILKTVWQSVQIETRHVPQSFVYEHPTIQSLSLFVFNLVSNKQITARNDAISQMHALVDKYAVPSFGTKVADGFNTFDSKSVLITGTTGGLGCYILYSLVQDPTIKTVYALNRSHSKITLLERQRLALLDKGLDEVAIHNSGKVHLMEADLTVPRLGIPPEVYEKMKHTITHIIPNAWRVDFNLSLTSFESNIKGLRNLIDLALSSSSQSPPMIIFPSSIGIFRNIPSSMDSEPLKEEVIHPEIAVGNGYAESKWVAEKILYRASHLTGLRTIILRVGQLSGGTNGAWNVQEWFPSLVQSAKTVKCLPSEDKTVSWVPLDIAASVIVDLCNAQGSDLATVVHLVHPSPVSLSFIMDTLSDLLRVRTVPYSQWLHQMEELERKGIDDSYSTLQLQKEVRALRLLDFFRRIGTIKDVASQEALGLPCLSVTHALSLSKVLADPNIRRLGEADIKSWLEYWEGHNSQT